MSFPLRTFHQIACLVLAGVLGLLLAAQVEAETRSDATTEPLTPRLAALADSSLGEASPAAQAEALSLAPEGAGSLARDGRRLLVEARFESGAAAATGMLRSVGAEPLHVSRAHQVVTALVRPEDLSRLAEIPRIASVSEVLTPVVRAPDCGGSVRSEGDAQLNAAAARASFALDGTGVTVGVLSDSFDRDSTSFTRASGDVASGDLPGPGSPCGSQIPVKLLDGDPEISGGDEGRAMAQIVHDLAPGASIEFASAFLGETAFADAIREMAAAGAKVIVDDVAYYSEPFFQDGPVAAAVDDVAAAGVSYFSAAGNDNLIDSQGRNIASWEAPAFRDSGGCPAAAVTDLGTEHCMDFDPGPGVDRTFGVTVAKGATLTVDLQWAEPWEGVSSDLNVFLLDATGDPLEAEDPETSVVMPVGSDANNVTTQRPYEFFQWENDGPAAAQVQVIVDHCSGACNPGASTVTPPRLKLALLQNGSGVTATEYPESAGGDIVGPTIFGHAAAAGAIAVGAVHYGDATKPESYSSRGPVRHLFGPVAGVEPAAPIDRTTAKPDLVATDCGVTTFFHRPTPSTPPPFRFCGTSAAAPHAAAVGALALQAEPSTSPAQMRAILTSTARPVGAYGPEAVGAGLIDATAALGLVAPPLPQVTILKAPPAVSKGRQPTIEFAANRPAAFRCEVDGSGQPCASPFAVPAALGDGRHAVAIEATDVQGRKATATVSFVVDTVPPRAFFRAKPRKVVRTRAVRVKRALAFGANEPGVAFVCQVDRDLPRFCPQRIVRRFEAGSHVVKLWARDAAGNESRKAVVFRFRVKRLGRG